MRKDFIDFKIIGGAMTWVSNPELVASITNEGGLGVLACGSMSPEQLDEALRKTKTLTSLPFGVNLILMHPQIKKLIQVCADHKVYAIVLGAAMPRQEQINEIKKTGAKALSFAASLKIAKAQIKYGIDALILEGNEAGGHIGPISTQVLVQEILFEIPDFPIFVAGGIGSGKMAKQYIDMGAVGCQMGTRFVCSKESPLHPKTKELYISKQARDTVIVSSIDPRFSVIPVRVIKNKAVEEFFSKQREALSLLMKGEINEKEAQLHIEHFWSGSLKRGVLEGDIERGSLMAGQSIGFVKEEESVKEIMSKIKEEMNV